MDLLSQNVGFNIVCGHPSSDREINQYKTRRALAAIWRSASVAFLALASDPPPCLKFSSLLSPFIVYSVFAGAFEMLSGLPAGALVPHAPQH